MQKLDYTIDQNEFDILILGTGMTEALFAASLAKIDRKKILILDADQGYSSSQKTFNFKELQQYLNEKNNNKQNQVIKNDFFQTLELKEDLKVKNQQFIEEVINKSTLFKQFNIDLQPKLLFSGSLTVDCMKQANMDQYMDFRAVDAIYFFEPSSKKLIQTPCSKSDIFKSKEFSLMEKKQLFQFLHKCVTIYNRIFDKKINQNSIEEFDKEFDVDEETINLYKKLSLEPCIQFLREKITSKKIQDIFLYNICNFEYNPNEPIPETLKHDYTTNSFLHRLNKYIKSCGIHTELPYLYTNYGTGDIPQGYARISAVFGSIYCLHKDLDIQKINQDQENGVFFIKTNLQRQPDEIVQENQSSDTITQSNNTLNNHEQHESKTQQTNQKKEENDQQVNSEIIEEVYEVIQNLQYEQKEQVDKQQQQNQEKPQEQVQQQNEGEQQFTQQPKTDVEYKCLEENSDKQECDHQSFIKEDNYIQVKNIIAGPEYKQKIKELLGSVKEEIKENMNLLRVTIISKKQAEQLKYEYEFNDLDEDEKKQKENRFTCPIIYSIPPNDLLGFRQPLSILQLDHNTISSPQSHQIFYCKKVLENYEQKEIEIQKIIEFIENIHLYLKGIPFKYTTDYIWAYIQNKNNQGQFEQISSANKKLQVNFIGQDFFEIDMDKNFEEFRNTISTISSQVNNKDENYFQTIEELNGEVDFYQNKIEEDEEFAGLDNLINKFEKLKENDNNQQQKQDVNINEDDKQINVDEDQNTFNSNSQNNEINTEV